jgi:hypothetical protein
MATGRLGEAADVWRVQPLAVLLRSLPAPLSRSHCQHLGALRLLGPGKYVDEMVDQQAPILERSGGLSRRDLSHSRARRYKPVCRVWRVSFPMRDNQVLFFNYAHTTRVPHPTFVYTGLDPFYQAARSSRTSATRT